MTTQYHDPFLMAGMEEAVVRIEQALENGEKILVYGDYDADGITSTTVLLNVLLDLGADVASSFQIVLSMAMAQMRSYFARHMQMGKFNYYRR